MKSFTHYLGWNLYLSHLILGIYAALCVSASSFAGEFNKVITIGDPLPAFNNLPATDGKTYSSNDFDEAVLVLVSLSNTCPFSLGIEKDLLKVVEQFSEQSVRFIGVNYNINSQDHLPAMIKAATERQFNFVYVRNDDQTLGRRLGTTVTPEWFVFDKDRKLIYTGLLHNSPPMIQGENKVTYLRGEPTIFYVADAIQATLNNHPVTTTETKAYGCTVEYLNAK